MPILARTGQPAHLETEHHPDPVQADLGEQPPEAGPALDGGPAAALILVDDFDLREILFNPGMQRLVVLPGGTPLVNSSEMLSSPRMAWLAQELRSRYPARIVLLDMPPLRAADDVLAFSPYLDAVLLVAEEGRTSREDLVRSRDLLRDIPVLGPVVNKSRAEIRVY